jgi:acyl-coenzyme A synthetase/AMP-(fatty) acid ligase
VAETLSTVKGVAEVVCVGAAIKDKTSLIAAVVLIWWSILPRISKVPSARRTAWSPVLKRMFGPKGFKIHGQRIEPQEVAETLSTVKGVAEVVCVGAAIRF